MEAETAISKGKRTLHLFLLNSLTPQIAEKSRHCKPLEVLFESIFCLWNKDEIHILSNQGYGHSRLYLNGAAGFIDNSWKCSSRTCSHRWGQGRGDKRDIKGCIP